MPRLQGVDLPPNKPLHISLRYLRGIGPTTSLEVCAKANVDPTRKANELTDDEIAAVGKKVVAAVQKATGGEIRA